LKILIIGLGSIGKKHVNAILSLYPDAQIFALRSISSSDQYLNVINIFHKEEIPTDLSFILISNITSSHEHTINEVIELNCPLFIEKPVLSDLSNANQLSTKIKESKVTTYIACNLRFHPAIEFTKQYLAAELPRINEVNIYCGSYLPEWRPGIDFRKIYSAKAEEGGGVHLDLIHEIDYCTWLFGFPTETISLMSNKSSLEISSVDNARFIFKYPEFNIGMNLNYYRRDAKREIEIVTDNDTLIVDLLKNKVSSAKTGEVFFERNLNLLETYENQMKYFINCIQSNESPMNDFNYSVEVLKLAINE